MPAISLDSANVSAEDSSIKSELELGIWELTRPVNGQYPRPWMTTLTDPGQANVFVVGKNQKNGYPIERVSQQRHIDALFNRNGETCRGLYDELTVGRPSPTRTNTDGFVKQLARAGANLVLETNVICYSTPMSADLSHVTHLGGRERGREIFRFLLEEIQPAILIAHGASTQKELEKELGTQLAPPAEDSTGGVSKTQLTGRSYNPTVYCVKSLAPPEFNKWSRWSADYLGQLAADVAEELKRRP